jgi:hypothetical protein
MNAREKFHAAMSFEPGAALPKGEFGYWAATLRRWRAEGLAGDALPESVLDGELVRGARAVSPGEIVDSSVAARFGLDSSLGKFPMDFSPRMPLRVLEEDARHRLFIDRYGITKLVTKENAATHHVVDTPIKSRADLGAYLERYDTDYAARLPAPAPELAAALANRDFPIRLGGEPFGFTYLPRALMGDVGYMTALHDDPGMVQELVGFILRFAMEYWSVILEAVKPDCVFILEDVAYRSGPMISPAMFEEFALPATARLVDFVRQFGVRNVFVDCDGKIDALIPLWVKAGVTGLFPVEAVNDIVAIRAAYPRLQLLGGVDKRPLISGGKREIDAELARIGPLLPMGGFVPHVDHAVPADISLESFGYYRKRLNDMIDAGGTA